MKQDPFSNTAIPVVIPELGTARKPITFLMWLVDESAYVIPGERIAEILVDSVVFHLDAPAAGHIRQMDAKAGELIQVGSTVATILANE